MRQVLLNATAVGARHRDHVINGVCVCMCVHVCACLCTLYVYVHVCIHTCMHVFIQPCTLYALHMLTYSISSRKDNLPSFATCIGIVVKLAN